MNLKKIAACVLSLSLVFALGAACQYTSIINDNNDTVYAEVPESVKLPVNNIHPFQERYIKPGTPYTTVPYSLTATLDNYDFELENGQTIDRETLKDHGIVITEECGFQHEEESMLGVISPLATPRTTTHSIDLCNVFIPSKLVNGSNKIYIVYRPDRHGIDTTATAELNINVKYTDSTADSAVKDYLPNHIDRGPCDIFKYELDENGETCLNVTPEKATVYTCDTDRTLIYDHDDIDSLKADFPELTVSEVKDTLTYNGDKQIPCKDMTAGKTYYKLDAGEMSDSEFTELCSGLKNSKYGNDVKLAKFVKENEVDHLSVTFVPMDKDYIRGDFQGYHEFYSDEGKWYLADNVANQGDCLRSYFFDMAIRLDVKDFTVDYTLKQTAEVPSFCYLQSVTSQIDSNDITDPYAQMVIPEVNKYDYFSFMTNPNMGGKDITMRDMTLVSQYIVGDILLTDQEIDYYDVTRDGVLTLPDLAMMKQYLMHNGVTLWPEN